MTTDVQPPLSEPPHDLIAQIQADQSRAGASIVRARKPHVGASDLLLPKHHFRDPVKYGRH